MKKLIQTVDAASLFFISAFASVMVFAVVWIQGLDSPNSIFCLYKIYKQPNGTYQVWWRGRHDILELDGATYEQAKLFQNERCKKVWRFNKPPGELVK